MMFRLFVGCFSFFLVSCSSGNPHVIPVAVTQYSLPEAYSEPAKSKYERSRLSYYGDDLKSLKEVQERAGVHGNVDTYPYRHHNSRLTVSRPTPQPARLKQTTDPIKLKNSKKLYQPTPKFKGSCRSKYYCREMSSCSEAVHYLRTCGLTNLDRDGDGIPCESICGS